MSIDYPYSIDGRGRTATVARRAHLHDLIEQVLMTSPGERVMRPDFGSGLHRVVFEPGGPEAVTTTQYLVQSSLQQWLGNLITVESVDVTFHEGELLVSITFVDLASRQRDTAEFRRTAP